MRRDTINIFNKLKEYSYDDIKNILPSKTNTTNFDNFKLEVSDRYNYLNSFLPINQNYKENLKQKGYTDSYISEMTPEEYLYLSVNYCMTGINNTGEAPSDNIETYIKIDDMLYQAELNKINNGVSNKNPDELRSSRIYAEKMKNGEKFNLPFLDFKNEIQDGNHRAAAAYINGYRTIPVLILY